MSASWLRSGFLKCFALCSFPATFAEDVINQPAQAQFEAFIRDAPAQWMWAHRKWD